MREARRLRGDVGRAIFKDEIEEEIYGPNLENKNNLEKYFPATLLRPVFRRLRSKEILSWLLLGPAMKSQNISFIVMKKNAKCAYCVKTCTKGVHVLKKGYKLFATPLSYKCNGFVCEKTENFCVAKCPTRCFKNGKKSDDGSPGGL